MKLFAADFPVYFEAVLQARVIDAKEAATDPRTFEFLETYLAPNDIQSMLDASDSIAERMQTKFVPQDKLGRFLTIATTT